MLKLQNHQSSDANPEPLIAWPGLHNLRLTLLLSLLVFVIFCLFFTGAGAITAMHSWRLHLFFDFEPGIPYVPQWGVVLF
jgi:hypothetical protein